MPEIISDESQRIFTVDSVPYPSSTEVLKEMGFIDTTFLTDEGADNGARRHEMIYLDIIDDLLSCDPIDQPYLDAWHDLLATTGATPIPELAEIRRYNHTYKYCGRPDAPVVYQGRREVWDIKTGKAEVWHRLQGGSYIGLFDDIFHGRCVYLQDNGKFKLSKEVYGRKDREDFLCILRTYHIRRNMYGH